jgi:hypothetical protein
MKHLKKFENTSTDLKPNPKWDDYVTNLFNQYMKMIHLTKFNGWDHDINIIEFFDSLQNEIDDSESIDVWKVYTHIGKNHHFIGLVKAYGELHAFIKMSIEFRDPEILIDSEAYVPEEEEIEYEINRLKDEIEKWQKVY